MNVAIRETSYILYMLNFLRTGQVQHNFDCTVITTNDLRFNTYNVLSTSWCVII